MADEGKGWEQWLNYGTKPKGFAPVWPHEIEQGIYKQLGSQTNLTCLWDVLSSQSHASESLRISTIKQALFTLSFSLEIVIRI